MRRRQTAATARSPPPNGRVGDGRVPVGIPASRGTRGTTSTAGCAGSGAPSRSRDADAATGPGRSVTRRSTRTSGAPRREAASSSATCAVPPSNAANGTGRMTAGAASRASARSPTDPPRSPHAENWATGKWIRSSASGRRTAWPRSLSGRAASRCWGSYAIAPARA